jgi:hypothetical protein
MRMPTAAIGTIPLATAVAPAFAQRPEPASALLAAVPRMMGLSACPKTGCDQFPEK